VGKKFGAKRWGIERVRAWMVLVGVGVAVALGVAGWQWCGNVSFLTWFWGVFVSSLGLLE
jgi:hypothetical protein